MRRALSVPLLPLTALALAGGCSDDPAPIYAPTGTMGGVTNASAATGTTGAEATTGADTNSTAASNTGFPTTGSGSTAEPFGGTTSSGAMGTSGSTAGDSAGNGNTTGSDANTTANQTTPGSQGTSGGLNTSGGESTTGGAGGATSTTGMDAGTTGSMPSEGSSGCGAPASQALGEWVSQSNNPEWAIYLPENYDPNRAYPLVVQLHGCTGGTNNVPVQRASGEDAIHVRGTGTGSNTCWDTQADLPIFDTMVDGVKAAACVDENRVFASGYSSGSWFVSVLACVRGDVLRAAGTVAGGNALFGNADCTGTIAQIFIHDLNDTENSWSGHESALERLIDVNGCTPGSAVPEDPSPCERYQGCGENPLKVCNTSGQGHNRQDDFAAAAFWEFFSEF